MLRNLLESLYFKVEATFWANSELSKCNVQPRELLKIFQHPLKLKFLVFDIHGFKERMFSILEQCSWIVFSV